jgi:hypothetical protein
MSLEKICAIYVHRIQLAIFLNLVRNKKSSKIHTIAESVGNSDIVPLIRSLTIFQLNFPQKNRKMMFAFMVSLYWFAMVCCLVWVVSDDRFALFRTTSHQYTITIHNSTTPSLRVIFTLWASKWVDNIHDHLMRSYGSRICHSRVYCTTSIIGSTLIVRYDEGRWWEGW